MLNTDQRPSKHVIVDANIAQNKIQQAKIDLAINVVQELMTEQDDPLQELNIFRSLCEPTTTTLHRARPIDPAVLAMLRGGHGPGGAGWNSLRPGPGPALVSKKSGIPVEHCLPLVSCMSPISSN